MINLLSLFIFTSLSLSVELFSLSSVSFAPKCYLFGIVRKSSPQIWNFRQTKVVPTHVISPHPAVSNFNCIFHVRIQLVLVKWLIKLSRFILGFSKNYLMTRFSLSGLLYITNEDCLLTHHFDFWFNIFNDPT